MAANNQYMGILRSGHLGRLKKYCLNIGIIGCLIQARSETLRTCILNNCSNWRIVTWKQMYVCASTKPYNYTAIYVHVIVETKFKFLNNVETKCRVFIEFRLFFDYKWRTFLAPTNNPIQVHACNLNKCSGP